MTEIQIDKVKKEYRKFNKWLDKNESQYNINRKIECISKKRSIQKINIISTKKVSDAFMYIKHISHDFQKENKSSYIAYYDIIKTNGNIDEYEIWQIINRATRYIHEENHVWKPCKFKITTKGEARISNYSDVLTSFKDEGAKIYSETALKECLQKYIQFNMKKKRFNKKNIEGISGWQYNEDNNCFDYVGITNDDAYRGFSNTDIFNNDKYDYLKKDYESTKLEDDTNALINLLDTDIKLIIPFSYSLLSICEKYLEFNSSNNKRIKRFALCMHGYTNESTSKVIINLFLNFFGLNSNSLHTFPRIKDSLVLSSLISSSKRNQYLRSLLADVPLMIYSNSNKSFSSKPEVKKIIINFINRRTQYYPVFISDYKINYDECYNFDIKKLDLPYELFSKNNKEQLLQLKHSINQVYISFINFISRIWKEKIYVLDDNTTRKRHFGQDDIFEQYKEHIGTFDYRLNLIHTKIKENFLKISNTKESKTNLYYEFYSNSINAVELFLAFLVDYGFTNYISKFNVYINYLYECMYDNTKIKNSSETDYLQEFKEYLRKIFIVKKEDTDYYHTAQFDTVNKENYYFYLEYDKYFDDFCEKQQIPKNQIKKADFEKILKTGHYINTYEHSTYIKRSLNNMPKGIKYLMIEKEALFPNEAIQPDN